MTPRSLASNHHVRAAGVRRRGLMSLCVALASLVLGLPVPWAIALAAATVTAYLLNGGFRSVVNSDQFMFVLMFGGMGTLALSVLWGDGFARIGALPAALRSLAPNGFDGWYLGTWFVLPWGLNLTELTCRIQRVLSKR